MNKKYHIQSYCHIKKGNISHNGNIVFQNSSEDFSGFSKAAYKTFGTNYPKFFKMDNLSKLAFLAADILLNENKSLSEKEENIALVFSNKASSLDTDRKFQNSISDKNKYYPSPSVFVYTLPNIGMGEISIKHTLFSEQSFFIFDHFNAEHLLLNATYLLKKQKADKVLCGWLDFDAEKYEAFLYLVSENGTLPHDITEITRLYNL